MSSFGDTTVALKLALIIVLLVVAAILLAEITMRPRHRDFRKRFRPINFDRQQRRDLSDVEQQLHAVMTSSFEKRRILSTSEYRLFAIVESEIAAHRAGYRVFAQANLGEILRSNNQDAFHSINSKRVDILVIDKGGWPFLAIEHQGAGHYQGNAAAQDAVKKEALRKAGVRYLEFRAADTEVQIRTRLREHLPNRAPTAQAH